MRFVTFAGPPSAGKTSVALRTAENLAAAGFRVGVVKFDCISTTDDERYRKKGIPVLTGISGSLCPDHYFITNIERCVQWGLSRNLDFLYSESAGLCNRCSPHIKGIKSLCVIDCLSGVNTPKKIGPMLLFADMVVITKGDIVSQAEREVFAFRAKRANKNARFLFVNGLTGEGSSVLTRFIMDTPEITGLEHERMRFPLPQALCSYCLGETRIGEDYETASLLHQKIAIPGEFDASERTVSSGDVASPGPGDVASPGPGGVAGAESDWPPAPAEGVGRDLGPAVGGDFPHQKIAIAETEPWKA